MWEFLSGLLEVASWLSFWRVLVAFFAGLAVGWLVGGAFADSSGFLAMFLAIVSIIPGYVWHRRSERGDDANHF